MSVCVIYIPFKGCVKHVSVTIPITTEHLGPYEIDASTINPDQPIDTAFTQTLDFAGSGTVGAFPFGFGWQQSPGFFNSTTTRRRASSTPAPVAHRASSTTPQPPCRAWETSSPRLRASSMLAA